MRTVLQRHDGLDSRHQPALVAAHELAQVPFRVAWHPQELQPRHAGGAFTVTVDQAVAGARRWPCIGG